MFVCVCMCVNECVCMSACVCACVCKRERDCVRMCMTVFLRYLVGVRLKCMSLLYHRIPLPSPHYSPLP